MRNLMMTFAMLTAMAAGPMLVGCDKTVAEDTKTTKRPDGSTTVDQTKTTQGPDGSTKTTTEHKANP